MIYRAVTLSGQWLDVMTSLSAHFQLTLTFVTHKHVLLQKMAGDAQARLHLVCCRSGALLQTATTAHRNTFVR